MRASARADTQITKPDAKAVDCGPRGCRQAETASARQRQAFPHPSRHLETSSLRTSSARGACAARTLGSRFWRAIRLPCWAPGAV